MADTKNYRAFGLTLQSEIPLAQVTEVPDGEPDVRIVYGDFSNLKERKLVTDNAVFFLGGGIARFRITNGDLIEVEPVPGCDCSNLDIFILGSCMGAILHQRGFMPIHGSCVTDGKRSVIITGDSGAGKSTLAAEFLSRGWMLLTDDVCAVYNVEGTPMIRASYPSQKLWQDAMDRYEKDGDDVHSLYFSESREKFGINVANSFFEGDCELTMVIRLLPADRPCSISPIEGMTRVDQLMRNTYRSLLIAPKDRPRHFQRCVTLSTKVPMALVIREKGKQCADILYDMILDYLGGRNHD